MPLTIRYSQSVRSKARVERARGALCRDLTEYVGVVPLAEFRKYLLPDLHPRINLSAVLQRLQQDNDIVEGRWASFPEDPSRMKLPPPEPGEKTGLVREDAVFANMHQLSEVVADACIQSSNVPLSQQLCRLRCNPSSIPICQCRDSKLSRPDSYIILSSSEVVNDRKARARWVEVAAPGEFKRNNGAKDGLDNRRKILWSLYHIMREDVRRRFVIGYTIEDRTMRLWYCSRSEVIASAPFDFITEHETVVHFLLSMMFASEQQLGWDPSIRRLPTSPDEDDPRYEIAVIDLSDGNPVERKYRTKEMIWNYGADAIRGRGTRVWSVVEVDEQGNEGQTLYALKEAWGDVDREPEGRLSQTIKARIAEEDKPYQILFEKYFMQVRAFGDVRVDSRVDRTDSFKASRNGRELSIIDTLDISVGGPLTSADGDPKNPHLMRNRMPEIYQTAETRKPAVEYSHKIHQRTVFNSTGAEIKSVDSLKEAFEMIAQVLVGLYVLHQINWVHRDISYGNVLVHKGMAKITDVEYAKELSDDSTHHGVRTGTPYFMAEEVRKAKYIFAPRRETTAHVPLPSLADWVSKFAQDPESSSPAASPTSATEEDATTDAPESPTRTTSSNNASEQRVFRHNPLHDMESVLWLSIFVVLVCEYENKDPKAEDQLLCDADVFKGYEQAQQELASKFFHNLESRNSVIEEDGFLAREASSANIHPVVKEVLLKLDKMRNLLVDAYVTAEKNITTKGHEEIEMEWSAVDMRLETCIEEIIKFLSKNPLKLVHDPDKQRRPLKAPKPKASGRAKRVADYDHGGAADAAGEALSTDDGGASRQSKHRKTKSGDDVSSAGTRSQPLSSLVDYASDDDESRRSI